MAQVAQDTIGSSAPRNRGRIVRQTLGAVAFSLLIVAAGCGGGDGGGDSSAPEPTGDQADDQGLVDGREVYSANCATCHALDGGGGQGPKLSGGDVADRYPDIADQIDIIANGKGQMPSWSGELSDTEIENVARYEREVL